MTTNELISNEDDVVLRRYAKQLHSQYGEDAYHNAVCILLEKPKQNIQNIIGLCSVCIKSSLYKIFRHESIERKNIEHFINNDPIPALQNLVHGRQKHSKCRKGLHDMVEENLTYVGARRTCLQCMRDRLQRKKRQ